MRRCRGAGLPGLAAVLLVTAGRAQVQQEPLAETTEGTEVSINCSHPNIQPYESIIWYRQLLGRAPTFITFVQKGIKVLSDPPGRLSVAADRRSSALWLAGPRRRDAAVYYCAVGDTGRGAGAAAAHEPPREGPAWEEKAAGQSMMSPPGCAAALPSGAAQPRPTSGRFPCSTGTGFSINAGISISGSSLQSLSELSNPSHRRLLRVSAPEGSKELRLGCATCGD
ncbi:immunoglobulin omega chain-like [Patagioenas fasciata monilis]|nr:immunoglobulin omega chain-like [Patagioenas fasciata monilis]